LFFCLQYQKFEKGNHLQINKELAPEVLQHTTESESTSTEEVEVSKKSDPQELNKIFAIKQLLKEEIGKEIGKQMELLMDEQTQQLLFVLKKTIKGLKKKLPQDEFGYVYNTTVHTKKGPLG
jgi:hypothetical protein